MRGPRSLGGLFPFRPSVSCAPEAEPVSRVGPSRREGWPRARHRAGPSCRFAHELVPRAARLAWQERQRDGAYDRAQEAGEDGARETEERHGGEDGPKKAAAIRVLHARLEDRVETSAERDG